MDFKNYWVVSGDTDFFEQELLPIMESIALFDSDLVAKNGTNYVLTNMTDPVCSSNTYIPLTLKD